jgi:ketosteroid isomerase-like protein
MAPTVRQTIERYWTAVNARDWDVFASLLHETCIYEIPQTRERVRGREAITEFNATFPGDWTLELERAVTDEAQAVSQIVFRLNGEEQQAITFFDFEDGQIRRITEYWPEPYDPPRRMTDVVERY